jgi:uncharacterized protein YdaU (DUF1376 family)
MSKSPAFQFYPKEWLSSMDIMLMTPEQEGAYIRLLCLCWESGDCSIPDDDQQLAMLCRLGEGWFKGSSTVVRKKFISHPNKEGFLTNERLLKEANKQADWAQKCSIGGKKSAEKRAAQQSKSKGSSRVVQGYLENSTNYSATLQSSVSSLHTPVLITPPPSGSGEEKLDPSFLAFWNAYPKKAGKGNALKEWKRAKPELSTVLSAIAAQVAWRASATRGEFRPPWKDPERWIKAGCWNDEVEAPLVGATSEYDF